MRRRTKVLLAVIAVLALGAIGMVAGTVRHGLSAHDEPTAIEALLARSVRNLAVPSDLRGAENPLPATPEIVAEGLAHWADHCASCHGNDGKGTTTIGQRLYPRPPDMTLPATQELSDGHLFAFIENGIRLTGMPGWGNGTAESAYGSWALVHFIRRLPQLTPEELAEMEALNPKSPGEWQALQEEAAFLGGGEPLPSTGAGKGHASKPHDH